LNEPPKLTPPKSRRIAVALNLAIPGAGQIYFGQSFLGAIIIVVFLVSLVVGVKCLLGGMGLYFSVAADGRLLEPGVLEELAVQFHLPWLIASLVVGIVAQIAAVALLYLFRPRSAQNPE
jgi:hypothetical protein